MVVKDDEQKLAEYAIEEQNKKFEKSINLDIRRVLINPVNSNIRISNTAAVQCCAEWFNLWRRN